MTTIGFSPHDHGACVHDAMARVETRCKAEGLQLTKVRRRTLEILLEQHRAMGAYELLEALSGEGLGSQPPVAYRALDFLMKHGFAHKIERLNAFVACVHPDAGHSPAFLICTHCARVAETEAQADNGVLGQSARDAGFEIDRAVIEVEGVCAACRAGDAGA